ncbi:hypothetical protein B0O99DRAFT_625813 [Bisporella sp. PMI_857]|nr:hypothetical protein B0O99DRAFT_625813 [Bisporella sp. PMI_857]
MVLLTASQVSVAISSFIIFMFTSALFFCGYALQQQTLRDLRTAIKPREPPPPEAKLYLPSQFAKPSPRQEGIVVEVMDTIADAQNTPITEQIPLEKLRPAAAGRRRKKTLVEDPRRYDLSPEEKAFLSELGKESKKDALAQEQPLSRAERRKRIKAELTDGSEEEGFRGYRRRMW